jgi:hypothetical protein
MRPTRWLTISDLLQYSGGHRWLSGHSGYFVLEEGEEFNVCGFIWGRIKYSFVNIFLWYFIL